MTLIDEVRSAWAWTGLVAVEVVGENDFGNLIVRDAEGLYWRVCPEELDCQVIARSRLRLDELSIDQEFLHDWYMTRFVQMAKAKIGELSNDMKYCLKIPSVLGGTYDESNIATISLTELVRASGHLALQVRNLPNGAQVKLTIVD